MQTMITSKARAGGVGTRSEVKETPRRYRRGKARLLRADAFVVLVRTVNVAP